MFFSKKKTRLIYCIEHILLSSILRFHLSIYSTQKIKRYLRNYCNYQQNDWTNWLSITEFASNACIFAFIEIFSFMTHYDCESRMNFNFILTENIAKKRILTKKTSDIFEKMSDIWKFIKKKLVAAQECQKR